MNTIYYNSKEIKEVISKNMKEGSKIRIAVAFITKAGLNEIFKNVDLNGKDIKVITTTDEYITDPDALDFLIKNNIKTRVINKNKKQKNGFHSKFFIFEKSKNSKGIVGSANITWNALNVKYETITEVEGNALQENFDFLWDKGIEIDSEFINNYRGDYRTSIEILKDREKALSIQANEMQMEALKDIEEVMSSGDNKALLWAATGSGKTILSALLARRKRFNKTLFIVHNRTIIRNAKRDFKKVFPGKGMLELFTENMYSTKDNDFIFTTEKTVDKILEKDNSFLDQFDYVVFDEAHKIGEGNKQNEILGNLILDKNKFILGMTATPMRSDDPRFVIKRLENIVGKITPKEALEKGLICGFKYHGVDATNIEFDVKELKNNQIEIMAKKFIDKLNEIKVWNRKRVKGILFVRTKNEAILLEQIMNSRGIVSKAIFSGHNDKPHIQNDLIDELQSEDGKLNFIISINKFNEGVDIPDINTVGMFRFTESNIIYSQQIGRGLRREKTGKKYLNIIDLVGNHKNSFERIIALNGETNGEPKDMIHKIKNSELDFNLDEIAAESILENLLTSSKVKYKKFYTQAFYERSLFEGRSLRLVEFKDKISDNLRGIINNIKPNTTTNAKDKSWLVVAHEAMGENLDSISDIENKIIDLFAWMPLTVSTPTEKLEIIKLLSNESANLKIKWHSYFLGKNQTNGKVSQIVKGDFKEFFTSDINTKEISFNLSKVSKKTAELLEEIREYLLSNHDVNDFQSLMQWYSRLEILFMQGYTATITAGKFSKFKQDEDYDPEENYYTNKIYNSRVKKDAYRNLVVDQSTFILSNDKVDEEADKSLSKIHNFVGTKLFQKDYMYLYIGTPKSMKVKDVLKKQKENNDFRKGEKDIETKEYTRFIVKINGQINDSDVEYLSS